jgi:hypothetical protein
MPPDESRNEGTPSQSEVPNAGAQTFWLLLGRLPKVTRRKGGTISRNTQNNGYSHNKKKPTDNLSSAGFSLAANA